MKSQSIAYWTSLILLLVGCKNGTHSVNEKEDERKDSVAVVDTSALLDTSNISTTVLDTSKSVQIQKDTLSIDTTASVTIDSTKFYAYYKVKKSAPAFNLNQDLRNKSLSELYLIKNTLLATKGYLFTEQATRDYFFRQGWYQPIFWDENFKLSLTAEEQNFLKNIDKHIAQKAQNNSVIRNNSRDIVFNNLLNLNQFANISPSLQTKITQYGLALQPTNYAQAFEIYKQNYFDNVPNFVTIDVFNQLMLIFLEKVLVELEEHSIDDLTELLLYLHKENDRLIYNHEGNELLKNAARTNTVFWALPLHYLKGQRYAVPRDMLNYYQEEINKIDSAARSEPSLFLDMAFMDYTRFRPTGHYLENENLRKFHLAFTWLSEAPFSFDKEHQLAAAILNAYLILKAPDSKLKEFYLHFFDAMSTLIGSVDEAGIPDIMQYISLQTNQLPHEFLTEHLLQDVKAKFKKTNKQRVNFMPKRNSIEREILAQLSNPNKRKLPKALDIFTVLENQTAEQIMQNHYQVQNQYAEYFDVARNLKFNYGFSWTKTAYGQWIASISKSTKPEQLPYFLQKRGWQLKNLQSALATFVHLNVGYDVQNPLKKGRDICNTKLPIPEGKYLGYVEPHIDYWHNCTLLIQKIRNTLQKDQLLTPAMLNFSNQIADLATFLKNCSEKELQKIPLSQQEYKRIHEIGFEIENLIVNNYKQHPVDNEVANILSLFTYKTHLLQEAIGKPMALYTVVEIEGWLYLVRGACYSYFEIENTVYSPINTQAWRQQLTNHSFSHPSWLKELILDQEHLQVRNEYKKFCE